MNTAAKSFNADRYRGGSDRIYKYPLGLKVTEGGIDMALAYGAFWLLDVVASAQLCGCASETFQVWVIRRKEEGDDAFVVEAFDDIPGERLYRQEIPFSDFPLDEFKFYCADGVVLLPEEY